MRVTGGSLGSRRVHAPRGRAVRPTTGRVREALFSILGARVVDARVLDLYAGTGALGFEALSRGASAATFVEAHRPTAAAIVRTAEQLGVSDRARVLAVAAERAPRLVEGRYDVVFADPPYAYAFPYAIVGGLRAAGCVDPETTIVYEHAPRTEPPLGQGVRTVRTERYGDVALSFVQVDDAT